MDLNKPANLRLYERIEKSIMTEPSEVDMDVILGVTHKEKKKNLTRILSDYTGKVSMLKDQLDTFGSSNPWVVASRMVPHDIELRSVSGQKKKHTRRVQSKSGHWITSGTAYQYIAKDDKSEIPKILWASGSTNIIKFTQAFGTAQQKAAISSEGRKRTNKKKTGIAVELDERYLPDLEEVLKDPKMLSLVRSTVDKQKIHHYHGLDDQIKKLTDTFEALRFSQPEFLMPRSYRQLTALEPGGQLINWVGNRIENTPQLVPEIVKHAHAMVTDDLIRFSDKKYKKSFGILMGYREMALPVDKEVILGSYIKDYSWLESLSPNHELLKRHGPLDASSVKHVLDEKGDITALEASQFMMIYPFREIRIEQNTVQLDKRKEELEYLEDKVKYLFMEDDEWMMDCVDSIPKRISKDSELGAYVKRADIATARDLLLLKTTSMNQERMLGSMAMEDFSELLSKSVVLSKRIRAKENGNELPKLVNYGAIEDFKTVYGLEFDEFLKRLKATYTSNDYWARRTKLFEKEAVAGVYRLPTKEHTFENLIPQLKSLTPTIDYDNKYQRAKELLKNPLVISPAYLPRVDNEYLHPYETKAIDDILEIEAFTEHTYGELVEGMIEQIGSLKESKFCSGNLEEELKITDVDPKIKSTSKIANVNLHDPDKMYEELIRIADEYKTVGTLPLGWIQKLKFLQTGAGYELLSKLDQSIRLTDAATIREVSENCYFSNELVDSVDDLYRQMQHEVKYNPSVIDDESRKELVDGLLDDTYRVKVLNTTKKDGKGVFSDKFPEFRYNFHRKLWDTRTDLTKISVADVSRRIKQYNIEKDAKLYLVLEKTL